MASFFHPNFLLQNGSNQEDRVENEDDHYHNHLSTSLSHHPLLPPSCNPQDFHGLASLLGKRSSTSHIGDETNTINHGEEELSDDESQMGEKKRRLNMEQVRTLEKNFELGNKLEPERKMQLARTLGLQPRQIAIWFQNRRARWKTKKLEKDYDVLKRQYEAVKAENQTLEAENKKLQAQIEAMKTTKAPTESINLNKLETEVSSSTNRSDANGDDNTSEIIKFDISSTPTDNNNNNNVNSSSSLSTHPLFPSSLQLFQKNNNVRQQHHHHQNGVKEENQLCCNMFCSVDDQTGFWPWLDQQHFN